ncbi:MAG: gliding motility lipoprotein GldD [Spirosomaceae bacterium]|jgi:gliding motility-associated lipoprotein GldD|nr:gliding motility lipoprotein GldD [Spirosomataceae bacterium]
MSFNFITRYWLLVIRYSLGLLQTINGKLQTVNCKLKTAHCLLLAAYCLLLTSCGSDTADYAPKPKGYPRMDLPAQVYQPMTESHPYTFEYSKGAVLVPDTFAKAEPHWIFVSYPTLDAAIQLTYKPVQNDPKRLQGFINDAYKLAGKHQIKASGMREQVLKTKSGKTAVVIDLNGDVPSFVQFYTTDTTTHYLRGALYFNVAEKQDSLQPAIDFIRKDIIHLLNTLRWKKENQ